MPNERHFHHTSHRKLSISPELLAAMCQPTADTRNTFELEHQLELLCPDYTSYRTVVDAIRANYLSDSAYRDRLEQEIAKREGAAFTAFLMCGPTEAPSEDEWSEPTINSIQ